MNSTDVQRKVTAIFCADVVGNSWLMGYDPEGTPTGVSKSGGRRDGG